MKKIFLTTKRIAIALTLVMVIYGSFGFAASSLAIVNPLAISTEDTENILVDFWDKLQTYALWIKEWARIDMAWIRDEGLAKAFKKTASNFLNQLAYDTATYLATGDEGAMPMFYTDGWKEYLLNSADSAVGTFLEELGSDGPVKFDLCDADIGVVANIGLGIQQIYHPSEPECTFTEMKKNWESELSSPDFMAKVSSMYNPSANDLGISLKLQGEAIERYDAAQREAALERSTNGGIKDVKDKVSNKIKTPGSIVGDYVNSVVEKTGEDKLVYTGHAIADAIDVFIDTLSGKLMDQWLHKGLVGAFPDNSYKGDWGSFSDLNTDQGSYSGGDVSYSYNNTISSDAGSSRGSISGANYASGGSTINGRTSAGSSRSGNSGANHASGGSTINEYTRSGLGSYEAQTTSGGVKSAREQFKSIIQPSFAVGGDYSSLNKLSGCDKPTKAATDECVMTDNLRRAVEKKLSVITAIKDGYLDNNLTFGFRADGLEPSYLEGLPYRSLIIMRKYRIIPVGWELAAQWIKDNATRTYNLGDMIACFDESDSYEGFYADWCKGLVDPSWVLKAPVNFCKREGAGPTILSQQIAGKGDDSELVVNRDENYCADEQTCIEENDDGACNLFGYCTSERRKYNFGGNSCDPRFNTCLTLRNRQGQTFSFLENTLDYSDCTMDTSGCKHYKEASLGDESIPGIYDPDNNLVNWASTTGDAYFNSQVEDCSEDNEGCHEYIRLAMGGGANMLINSSFEKFEGDVGTAADFEWWGTIGTAVKDGVDGDYALQLGAINKTITIDAPGFTLDGQTYTLSAYIKDCTSGQLTLDGDSVDLLADDWRLQYVAHNYSGAGNQITIGVTGAGGCLIDAIKLERSNPTETAPTDYSDYRGNGLIYQRLKPDYLDCTLPENAEHCSKFVQECTADDLDCALYTSVNDEITVPAKVKAEDYCPEACVDYDSYLQSETQFEAGEQEYFIPKTATPCGALAAGCDAFVNLDTGGGDLEYFSYLRPCVSPGGGCATYYTWEGSENSGYQLRTHELVSGGGGGPSLTNSGTYQGLTCAGPEDVDSLRNPLCWEFYDEGGNVYYAFYPYTIACADDCYDYQRQADSAVYKGALSESRECTEADEGCREYTGNNGANMHNIITHDFEYGTTQTWTGDVTMSSDSVFTGGHSMLVNGTARLPISTQVIRNRAYVIRFLARSGSVSDIYLENGDGVQDSFGGATMSGDWELYELNLGTLSHKVDSDEELVIVASGVNFDYIYLQEVVDRYYVIKDSWKDNCDYLNADPSGTPIAESHYAGCEQYIDGDGSYHNIYQFNDLCEEGAVGCELMIDTHNYTDYSAGDWIDADGNGRSVDADNYTFVSYKEENQCNGVDKGCERLGLEYVYDTDSLYYEAFIKDDPNRYDNIICPPDAVNCETWEYKDGISYFKDPGDMVCEWRARQNAGISDWEWFRKKITRCDDGSGGGFVNGVIDNDGASTTPVALETAICRNALDCGISASSTCERNDDCRINVCDGGFCSNTGTLCANDSDCEILTVCVNNECRFSCILDKTDYKCDTDYTDNDGDGSIEYPPKTFGIGGEGSKITQPLGALEINPLEDEGKSPWVGMCPANKSGCTEYIDPVSSFSAETKILIPNTLYIPVEGGIGTCGPIYHLDLGTNMLADAGSELFYYAGEEQCDIPADSSVRPAVIDYQLEDSVDKKTCNGILDSAEGCLLFNERNINGVFGYHELTYNAPDPSNAEDGLAPNSLIEPFDTNMLIKVTPDRECRNWLACRSFIKDKDDNDVCFDIGLCDSVDDNGNCNNFIDTNFVDTGLGRPLNQVYDPSIAPASQVLTLSDIADMSGYSKVGYAEDNSLFADYFHFGDMRQVGQVSIVPNGNFESFGSNMYPLGWTWEPPGGGAWNRGVFKVINNPVAAQNEGISYPVEGKSFMKIGSDYFALSEWIELAPQTQYMLTAWMNTLNLTEGTARLDLEDGVSGQTLLERGNKWTKKMIVFNSGGATRMRIRLSAPGGVGNFYYDDIKIRPTLYSKYATNHPGDSDFVPGEWYTPQTCRLYPESNSLSCEYQDAAGHDEKGWPGYCLEYDRYPGSPDACLLWYPVDKVYGDSIEEGGGYNDRKPLYYCTATTQYDYGELWTGTGGTSGSGNSRWTGEPLASEEMVDKFNLGGADSGGVDVTHRNPLGWSEDVWELDQLGLGKVDSKWLYWKNIDHIRIRQNIPSIYCDDIFQPSFDGYIRFVDGVYTGEECADSGSENDCIVPSTGIEILSEADPDTGEMMFSGIRTTRWDAGCNNPDYYIKEVKIYPKVFYCSELVQTVTPTGRNKYFSDRIYEGSNYTTPCNASIEFSDPVDTCDYDSDLAPFGAIVQPGLSDDNWSLMANPFEWDSREIWPGKQPLYYEFPSDNFLNPSQARMGQEHSQASVQQMFNQFFGIWTWQGEQDDGYYALSGNWNGPASGPTVIGNILINRNVAVTYRNNSLINLTFTTNVAPNALPLVSIKITWGDTTEAGDPIETAISGVEMHDRQDPDYPHSFYHIYSIPEGLDQATFNITIETRDNWGGTGSGGTTVTIVR